MFRIHQISTVIAGHTPVAAGNLRRSTLVCLGLLVVMSGLACRPAGPAPAQSESMTEHRDGLGRAVRIVKRPARIISLAPNVTEILFALQLDDQIVGVTSYCDYPATALSRERVGDTLSPNLERIIAQRPDLVIVSTSSQLEVLTRQLDQLAIPVYVTNPRTIRDILTTIRQVGEITGQVTQARELTGEMEARIRRIEERVGLLPTVRVLYALQIDPLITAGRDTFLNDLIRSAGGESISGGEEVAYPQFSYETVIARAPEVILLPEQHGSAVINESALRRSLGLTPAVKNGRIVRINPDWADRPGPRIVEALEQFAQALHPESP